MRSDERGALGNKSTIRGPIIAIVVVILSVPLLTSISYYKVLSPFSLPDPSFALFFLLLAISCTLSYLLLEFEKSLALHPLLKAAFPTNANIFQLAYFLFGKNRAVQTAIVDLVRRQLLVVTKDNMFLVQKEQYIKAENEQNPLIPAMLKEERTCITYKRIISMWFDEKLFVHPVLHPIQLLAKRKEILLKPYCLLLLPFIIGVTRFVQYLATDQNTGKIFCEIIFLSFICWPLLKHVTRLNLMRLKARQLADRQRETHVFYPHSVVSNFAFEGNTTIERYADGLTLIAIFELGPFIDKVSDGVVAFLEYTAEEKEGMEWAGKSSSDWNYTKSAKTLMKEIEDKTLSR